MTKLRRRLQPLAVRRAEICRTAARLIRDRGFEATSLRDIARAVGISKSGLYHYTSGKDALLFEIMSFGMDQIETEVVAPVRVLRDPEERLYELVERHVRIATRAGGAVAELAGEVRSLPALKRRTIQRRMREYVDFVHAIIDDLAAAGRLREMDATVATYMVFGSILWVPRWFREGGRLTAPQVASEVARVTVTGLLRPVGQLSVPAAARASAAPRGRRVARSQ